MGAEQASLLASPPYSPRTPLQESHQTLNLIATDIFQYARVHGSKVYVVEIAIAEHYLSRQECALVYGRMNFVQNC